MSENKQLWPAPDAQVAALAPVLWVLARHVAGRSAVAWEETTPEVKAEFRGYARRVLERQDRPGWVQERGTS